MTPPVKPVSPLRRLAVAPLPLPAGAHFGQPGYETDLRETGPQVKVPV